MKRERDEKNYYLSRINSLKTISISYFYSEKIIEKKLSAIDYARSLKVTSKSIARDKVS